MYFRTWVRSAKRTNTSHKPPETRSLKGQSKQSNHPRCSKIAFKWRSCFNATTLCFRPLSPSVIEPYLRWECACHRLFHRVVDRRNKLPLKTQACDIKAHTRLDAPLSSCSVDVQATIAQAPRKPLTKHDNLPSFFQPRDEHGGVVHMLTMEVCPLFARKLAPK